jgi:hypothetical protein
MTLRSRCPRCKALIDASEDVNGELDRPTPGSLSVCCYCLGLSQWVGAPLTLALFPEKQLPHEAQGYIFEVRKATLEAKMRNI